MLLIEARNKKDAKRVGRKTMASKGKAKTRKPFAKAKGPRAIKSWRRVRPFKPRTRRNVTPPKKKAYLKQYYRKFRKKILAYKRAWYRSFGKLLARKYRAKKISRKAA